MSFNNGNTYSKSYSRNNKRPLFGKRSPHPQSLLRPPPPKRIRTDDSYQSDVDSTSSHRTNSNEQTGHIKSRDSNSVSRYNDTSFQTNSRYQGSRYNNNTSSGTLPMSMKRDETKAEFLSHLPKGPKSVETSRYNSTSITTNNNTKNNMHTTSNYYNHKSLEVRSVIAKKAAVSVLTQKRSTSVYQRIMQVGEGTYGKVYKAKNTITEKLVALKKLRLQGEKEGFPITSIREIKLLQSFDHPNVSTIKEIMVESQKTVYMIFEYADNDLSGLLLNKEVKISHSQCKHLFKQLLLGMEYLHDNKILHRDVKGSNILIDNQGNLKITDFGLARKMNSRADYTNRVITLWYRPPELLLGTTNYGAEVDMWGCGCLLVELFNKTAIFQGSNELEQIESIFKIMGTPTIENWPRLYDMPWFFMIMPQQTTKYISAFSEKFKSVLPSAKCLQLATSLLYYDQRKRSTATEALQSDYFKEEPKAEPLILDGLVSCHEYEVKLARKQKRSNIASNNTINNNDK
ncbi:cyclin-dependent serine/threonine protein kinase CTK1 SKDI_11G0810 [Saccharomyces kudriavzevii IFO 1802]|uniref:Uncharacterized protein n=2 Tax=Saccharomyces kudriavzevii (strain ATCC MYA-4449 / AS 2.2408 / CBS 8840 / NBRC 1802 / NCYC 2889) TaxID=226230 RepID=A0AA35J3B1_SACK1|nr:uncharacterized protein SKDI_11G0810 [Saccharomyces kudriavzevii IFO 1802]EJT42353.1 CTK1-like protein [Saccharomyces kudriavzevii IFO 1802]CAI4044562.1 hypothetical protein SKDI_11G0810 [Saccharomyces kudriavzevii IFO 1802]